MKYGVALKSLMEALYLDRSSVDTTYTTPNTIAAVKTIPAQWKSQLMGDFSIIVRELEKSILSCPHPESSRKVPYDGAEKCEACLATRRYELEDNDPMSWNERKTWSKWRV